LFWRCRSICISPDLQHKRGSEEGRLHGAREVFGEGLTEHGRRRERIECGLWLSEAHSLGLLVYWLGGEADGGGDAAWTDIIGKNNAGSLRGSRLERYA
jgi:hypothetical protein